MLTYIDYICNKRPWKIRLMDPYWCACIVEFFIIWPRQSALITQCHNRHPYPSTCVYISNKNIDHQDKTMHSMTCLSNHSHSQIKKTHTQDTKASVRFRTVSRMGLMCLRLSLISVLRATKTALGRKLSLNDKRPFIKSFLQNHKLI